MGIAIYKIFLIFIQYSGTKQKYENKQTNKQTLKLKWLVPVLIMGLILCVLQSCSTEELLTESESNRNVRDYSYEEITFLDLKKINNNAFIESAKLKKVIATSKNKNINSASNYDIDLKSIRYIKRKNNDETFSFRIFQIPTATFQQNIVVECKKNEKPQSYLVTYYLNKQLNQINNSDDFIKAIKSTSIIKIEDPLKTHRTTIGGCVQIGYYDDVEVCEGNLDTRPHCYESDGKTRATIKVFEVLASDCTTGGVSDFTPLASQWNQYNTAPSDSYSGNTGSPAGGGVTGESTGLNIFAPNYYENGDLSDPAVQNMLQINQFLSSLYISSNEIKGAVDSTEWLLAYTNYWIGTNGGLTPSNQIALTYAFNNIPMLFNQYNGTSYELNAINNFKFSSFQFLLFHGEFLSKLDPLTQKSILDKITSLEKIELINNVVNFMIENSDEILFTSEILKEINLNPSLNIDLESSFKSPFNIDKSSIKDVTEEDKKFNKLYDALKTSPEFKKLFIDLFDGDNSRINVKFEIADRVFEDNDSSKPEANATTSEDPVTKNLTIKISKQLLIAGTTKSQTNIENAKTILHECIHAYLFSKVGNPSVGANFVTILNTMYPTPNEQHDFMYGKMIPTMQKVLGEIRDLVTTQAGRNKAEERIMYTTLTPLTSTSWNWNDYYKYISLKGLGLTSCFLLDFPKDSDQWNLLATYIKYGNDDLQP